MNEPRNEVYKRALVATSEAIFGCSVISAKQISEDWRSQAPQKPLSNDVVWAIQIELMWLFVAAISRDVFQIADEGSTSRDEIQDDLVSEVINYSISRMYDQAQQLREVLDAQAQKLLGWYNEADMDYGVISVFHPLKQQINFEDNLAGKWANRIAKLTGHEGNTQLLLALSSEAMEAYIAANIPQCTVDLIGAV